MSTLVQQYLLKTGEGAPLEIISILYVLCATRALDTNIPADPPATICLVAFRSENPSIWSLWINARSFPNIRFIN